jgi:peptidoglycan/LPS O-acetylase OafA/YrhL
MSDALHRDLAAGVALTVPAPRANTAAAERADHYPWFDWLRAVLAIVVMLHHDEVIAWGPAGSFAVEVFFALSGWLIGALLLKLERRDLPRFYFIRAVRIWAPYYIGFAMFVAASLLKDPITAKWGEFIAYQLLMVWNLFGIQQLAGFRQAMPLQGTGNHYWSVNAEEQFYLLAPLLLVLAARWGRAPLLWGALALVSWWTHTYAAIVLGVFAAVAAARWGDWHRTPLAQALLLALALATAGGLALGHDYARLAPLCGIAIVLLLTVRGRATRLGTIAGGMSYPLYLNHWIGVFAANVLMSPFGLRDTPARQLLAVAIDIPFAVLLYWAIDRQLLARRQAWYTPARGRIVSGAAYAMVAAGLLFGWWMLGVRSR